MIEKENEGIISEAQQTASVNLVIKSLLHTSINKFRIRSFIYEPGTPALRHYLL